MKIPVYEPCFLQHSSPGLLQTVTNPRGKCTERFEKKTLDPGTDDNTVRYLFMRE